MQSIYDLDRTPYANYDETRSAFFMLLSSVLHSVLFGLAMWMSLNVELPKVKEIIEFEISGGSSVTATPAPPAAAAPEVAEAPEIKAPIVKTTMKPAPVMAAKSSPAARAHQAVPAIMPKAAFVQTQSDVTAPALEDDEMQSQLMAPVALSAKDWDSSDADQDFEKVNQQSNAKIQALTNDMDSEADEALNEHETAMAALAENQKLEDQKLAKAVDVKAQERASAEAALVKAEQKREQDRLAAQKAAAAAAAAALAAQQAEQNRLARERAAAALAAQRAQAAHGAGQGHGNSSQGSETSIRRLEDLRQMPGNKKPQYAEEDRLAGRAGHVAFAAYISHDGQPMQVKLLKSSGHRSLDLKTLTAIKQWRFYPGQEGWVEIPFEWELKGSSKERPMLLRRSSR